MIVLSIITVLIILYLLSLFAIFLSYKKNFGNRFVINPLITYYEVEEFECVKKKASFKIDDLTLNGYFVTPKNNIYDKSVIIVFCHGMWSSKEAYYQEVGYVSKAGFEVFTFDYIGTHESEGKSIGGLASGLKSVDYAIKYVHDLYPSKDIYVMGHSWGGFTSINSVKYNPYVKKICSMSPFININKAMVSFAPHPFKFLAYNSQIFESFKYGKYAFADSIKTLKDYDGKVLILHSTDDHMIKYKDSTKILEKKFKDYKNINFIVVDKRGHNPDYSKTAVKKLKEFVNKLSSLNKEEQILLMQKTNFNDLGRLDKDIMKQIIEFFKEK